MRDQEELTILSGLLDFYSDRATAHAGFVVAEIFGLYTLLFSGRNTLPSEIFFLAFSALVVFNIYSFMNFGYYAESADFVRKKLEGQRKEKYLEERKSDLGRATRIFYTIRNVHLFGYRKYLFFFLLWLLAVILPFFWILIHL